MEEVEMRAFGSLIPLLVIGLVVYVIARAAKGGDRSQPEVAHREVLLTPPVPAAPRGLAADLDRWVAAGLVTHEQRTAILAHEGLLAAPARAAVAAPAEPARPRRIPAVAEALGYLGGILAVTGLMLVVSRYWPDMATAGRLALSGSAAAALLGAGALTKEAADPALARLRWFLWLAATAATALFAGVASLDGMGAAPETVALACAASVTVLSGLLWRGRDRPVQQLTLLGGIAVAVGAGMAELATGTPVGLAVWVAGAALVVIGLRRAVAGEPILTEGAGALAVVVGSIIAATDSHGFGQLVMVASAGALLALATVPQLDIEPVEQKVLGIIGGLTLLQGLPGTLAWFSRDAGVATGLATWAIGGLLLFAGTRGRTRLPLPTELLGGAGLIGGAALTGVQSAGFAPLFGIATGAALVALGTRPGQVLLSVLGSVGLLVNVPWAIGHFFPGEGRAPLLIMVAGGMIIGLAVLLTRSGGRFRHDLAAMRERRPPRGGVLPGASR